MSATTPPLTDTQVSALFGGKPDVWQGAQEVGVRGDTMRALERRGLARVAVMDRVGRIVAGETYAGDNRLVYRLTPAGVVERDRLGDA